MTGLAKSIARTDDVKRAAKGRWDIILSQLVPEIRHAMERPGRHVTCPFHGGKLDFRVTKDFAEDGDCHCTCGHWDGLEMVKHARNWTFQEVVAEVEAALGGVGQGIPASAPAPAKPRQTDKESEAIKAKLQKYWAEAVPLDAPEAELGRRYLAGRGLEGLGNVDDWRFHDRLPYYDAEAPKKFSTYPALVGVLRMADGRVATIHRTWLEQVDGRIKVVERKLYSSLESNPISGGAIRLCEADGPVLNIAEGIETTLSARVIAPEYPVWSCVNKELMKTVRLPDHVRVVTVFADRDRSYGGQEAAVELVERLRNEGRRAMMFLPPVFLEDDERKGVDWNDFLQTHGTVSARNHFHVQRWRRDLAQVLSTIDKS